MALPHHRHQSSLEGILDFSSPQPLEQDQLKRATNIFNRIVALYEPLQTNDGGYKRITLLRIAHDSVTSRDNFLRYFFLFVEKELRQTGDASELNLSRALCRYVDLDSWNREQRTDLERSLAAFSDFFVNNFLLPRTQHTYHERDRSNAESDLVKASARKTPQPTPTPLSGSLTSEKVVGTTRRLSNLRRDCLLRDGHRCVISRKFDIREARERVKQAAGNAKDDDGQLLNSIEEGFEFLEVAHILPHSLMSVTAYDGDSQLVLSDPCCSSIIHPC